MASLFCGAIWFGVLREPLDTLTEANASKPWYRRAWEFATDAHKLLTAFGAICAFSIGAHAWIAGLVTKKNVEETVNAAVVKAMLETNGKVSDLQNRTSGLPEWRIATHDMVTRHEERVHNLEKQQEKLETRFDRYLSHR